MDYFKKIERSVTISADKRSTVDLQVDVWSQDLNVTKFILKLDTTDSAAIDLTNATVRVAMVYNQDGQDVKIEAAGIVEDVATQKIAYVMGDRLAGFEGQVTAGFYVTLSTGQRIDIQNVTFNMRKSLLDKDLDVPTENYYQTFDDIVADVQSAGDTAKAEIKATLPTLQNQVNELSESIIDISGKFETVVVSKNLHNESTDKVGKYIQDNIIKELGIWTATDFIDVGDYEETYLFGKGRDGNRTPMQLYFLNTYDKDKHFINCVDMPKTYSYVREEGVRYIRFCYQNNNFSEVDLSVENSRTHTEYKAYLRLVGTDYVKKEEISKTLEIANNIEYVIGKNLFDESKVTKGTYVNSKGEYIEHQEWNLTDFMYVYGATNICCSVGETIRSEAYIAFWTAYDENKDFISQFRNQATSGEYPVSIPEGTHYLRVCYKPVGTTNLQIEVGEVFTGYEPFELGMKFIKSPYNRNSSDLKWKNKKWVCVGDSLTEVNNRTTMHYHDYISQDTGISVINMGASGTGYKRDEEKNRAFYQRVQNIPTDVDVVTIFGSGNDLTLINSLGTPTDTNTDTICGCINKTIDIIIDKMPTVSLGIVSPTPWVGEKPTLEKTGRMERYSEALKQICEIRSIPFLNLYHCSNLRPWTEEGRQACYSKDEGNGVHPDENGHKLIAPRFKEFLESLIM